MQSFKFFHFHLLLFHVSLLFKFLKHFSLNLLSNPLLDTLFMDLFLNVQIDCGLNFLELFFNDNFFLLIQHLVNFVVLTLAQTTFLRKLEPINQQTAEEACHNEITDQTKN